MACTYESCISFPAASLSSSPWPSSSSSYFTKVYKAPGALIQTPEPYYATHDTMPPPRKEPESPCCCMDVWYHATECKREKKRYEHEESDVLLNPRPYKVPRAM